MKSEIWIVEIGHIEKIGTKDVFCTTCISSEAYSSFNDAVAFIEGRYGHPYRTEMHLVWKSGSSDGFAYRLKCLTLVS